MSFKFVELIGARRREAAAGRNEKYQLLLRRAAYEDNLSADEAMALADLHTELGTAGPLDQVAAELREHKELQTAAAALGKAEKDHKKGIGTLEQFDADSARLERDHQSAMASRETDRAKLVDTNRAALGKVGGREVYLGRYGSPESRERFTQLLAGYDIGTRSVERERPVLTSKEALALGAEAGASSARARIEAPALHAIVTRREPQAVAPTNRLPPTAAIIEPTRPLKSIANAIDPKTDLILLADVPKLPWMPRLARPLNKTTVWRWHAQGIGGVFLETLKIGNRRYTSESAVLIFFSDCASAETGKPIGLASGRTARSDKPSFSHDRAAKELASLGL